MRRNRTHALTRDQRNILGLIFSALVVLAILLFWMFAPGMARKAHAETDARTYEYYRLKYQGVIDALHFRDDQTQEVWSLCGDGCVNDILKDNGFWIKPLAKTLNEKSGQPNAFTDADVARYAQLFSWNKGVVAEDDCKKNLIRDAEARGAFPTQKQFDSCAMTMDKWVAMYADIVDATQKSFDVPPPVFAVNEWSDRRFWKLTCVYGGNC